MLVCEVLGDELDDFKVRIVSTDIDSEAIAFARQGLYSPSSLDDLPAELAERYFVASDRQYQVKKRVRNLTVFGEHDLGQRAPFPHIDLVVCRNVLIYFTAELQRRSLQLFAFSLREEGFLALGKAETTSPFSDLFSPYDHHQKVYARRGERVLIPPVPIGPRMPSSSLVAALISRTSYRSSMSTAPKGRRWRRPRWSGCRTGRRSIGSRSRTAGGRAEPGSAPVSREPPIAPSCSFEE